MTRNTFSIALAGHQFVIFKKTVKRFELSSVCRYRFSVQSTVLVFVDSFQSPITFEDGVLRETAGAGTSDCQRRCSRIVSCGVVLSFDFSSRSPGSPSFLIAASRRGRRCSLLVGTRRAPGRNLLINKTSRRFFASKRHSGPPFVRLADGAGSFLARSRSLNSFRFVRIFVASPITSCSFCAPPPQLAPRSVPALHFHHSPEQFQL